GLALRKRESASASAWPPVRSWTSIRAEACALSAPASVPRRTSAGARRGALRLERTARRPARTELGIERRSLAREAAGRRQLALPSSETRGACKPRRIRRGAVKEVCQQARR